ncbi:MAG: signal peptide peptidase SppA [Bacteroidales bacterium]|nr:signal peptide peptidase SppA [Bacteroidales bacterium]
MNENIEQNSKPETRSRKFWRVVLGSMVGFVLASIIVSILSLLMFLGMIASFEKLGSSTASTNVKDNSVLLLDLSASINERAVEMPFDFGEFAKQSLGLDDILKAIDGAASDSKIKGIYLKSQSVGGSPATVKAIRDALMEFKKCGKFVYAYNDIYSQNAYYVATVADKILLNPVGDLDLKGYAFQVMFYKNLIDKLDVDVQIFRHGQFKSAVEPYFLDKMSDANREQISTLANSLWDVFLQDVSKARKISADQLNGIADSLLCSSPQEALKLKLVDKLAYSDEAEQLLKSKMNLGSDDKINYVSVIQYVKSLPQKKNYSSNKVAVMYAFGEISDGKGDSGRGIYSDTFVKDFRKVYKDKDVKAIVLRVNSPGGSALASENIWHEIELAKKAGKKIVVSMGDYAASGGYYISCNADYIIAEPNTITGSIGVFGMIPTVQNFLKNKIGITVDEVGTNKHSDFGSLYRPLDALESERVQASIEEIYGTFTKRVADGRHLDVAYVDSIGQGRVWAGSDALKLGLVDKMGNINDAIAKAAELAQLEGFDVCYYPEKKDWFSMIFSMKDDAVDAAVRQKMGIYYQLFNDMQQVLENEGVQARMPMTITIQ